MRASTAHAIPVVQVPGVETPILVSPFSERTLRSSVESLLSSTEEKGRAAFPIPEHDLAVCAERHGPRIEIQVRRGSGEDGTGDGKGAIVRSVSVPRHPPEEPVGPRGRGGFKGPSRARLRPQHLAAIGREEEIFLAGSREFEKRVATVIEAIQHCTQG